MFVEHDIVWDDEKVARLWDHYSHSSPVPYFSEMHGEQLLRRSGLPLDRALRVCDFGCGPGFIWQHLQRLGAKWQYTGIDFSPDSVAKLRATGNGQANFIGAHHVDGIPTQLPAEQFDIVLLIEVVEHLSDEHLRPTIEEAFRLLAPGGRLLISTPNDENLAALMKFCAECGARFHEWQHVRKWTQQSLPAYVEPIGFATVRIGAFDFGAKDILRKGLQFLRRRLISTYTVPHMLAVFRRT